MKGLQNNLRNVLRSIVHYASTSRERSAALLSRLFHREKNLSRLQQRQQDRIDKVDEHRANLSTHDLRRELHREYGNSGWAKKLIQEIISLRDRQSEHSLFQRIRLGRKPR